ncbi:MAG: efflux RND transporter periplasmic adaptor subunit [Deltaproteobacteria bacterium]|nr:efflux RND transporter periplasmic adaptor subunit [Deltaproteobacteria bacterium]
MRIDTTMRIDTAMRHTAPRPAFTVVLVAAFTLTLACGGDAGVTRLEGKNLTLEVRLDPPTPRTGENRMEVRVLGAGTSAVSGADVVVKVTMPAMGAMAAMGGPVPVTSLGDGRYEARFPLDMAGTWRVGVRARTPAGDTVEAEGSLITGQPGVRLSLLGAGTGAPASGAADHDHGASGDTSRTGDQSESTGEHVHGTTPATAARTDGEHPGEILVDTARRQAAGIRTAPARSEPFGVTIRAVGIVGYDQGALHDVVPRVTGYVGSVSVSAAGEAVRAGDPLLTFYSPDLLAAQKEFLTARASERREGLVRAGETRLRLWGMSTGDIERLATTGEPSEYVSLRAPASGVVVEKNVVPGSATQAGERVFRIATIDRVWIEAELYEADLALVRPGTPARVSLPYLPGERFEGAVSLVSPLLEAGTRTARARVEVANPGHALMPGMYATVELRRDLGERLVVPASAVLYAGDRRFVFLDVGDGRLRPQAVETGRRDGERLEVISGLTPGQQIVVSGNYLVASESRLGSALEQW